MHMYTTTCIYMYTTTCIYMYTHMHYQLHTSVFVNKCACCINTLVPLQPQTVHVLAAVRTVKFWPEIDRDKERYSYRGARDERVYVWLLPIFISTSEERASVLLPAHFYSTSRNSSTHPHTHTDLAVVVVDAIATLVSISMIKDY